MWGKKVHQGYQLINTENMRVKTNQGAGAWKGECSTHPPALRHTEMFPSTEQVQRQKTAQRLRGVAGECFKECRVRAFILEASHQEIWISVWLDQEFSCFQDISSITNYLAESCSPERPQDQRSNWSAEESCKKCDVWQGACDQANGFTSISTDIPAITCPSVIFNSSQLYFTAKIQH